MCVLHQLLLGTLGTDDVGGVRDEATADQRRLAAGAAEAVVVPVAILERNESRTTDACWPNAEGADSKKTETKKKPISKHSYTIGFALQRQCRGGACVRAHRF